MDHGSLQTTKFHPFCFFRELPDPLFCSEYANEWKRINKVEDELERIREIKHLLGKLPKPNRDNIEYLFQFLEKIVAEEFYNKMSVENLLVVFSPNLLWNCSGQHVPIDAVQKSMIVRHAWIFDTTSNISNLLTVRSGAAPTSDHKEDKDIDVIEEEDGTDDETFVLWRPSVGETENVVKRSTIRRKEIKAGKLHRSGVSMEQRNYLLDSNKSMEENLSSSWQSESGESLLDSPISSDLMKETIGQIDGVTNRSRRPLFQTMARSLDIDLPYVPSTDERLCQNNSEDEEGAPLLGGNN